jgi:threonine/homoserine/homoserine lactone efflux protein
MSLLEQALIAFTLAAALLTVTPGIDTALVLRTAAAEGSHRAFWAGFGICLGCLAWGAIVALGLGMLLQASELAYTALRWAGALYLLYLGFKLLKAPRRDFGGEMGPESGGSGGSWFWRGLLTNLLNPKVGVFYVSFLPQFIPAGTDVAAMTLLLAAIHALLGLIWFGLLILATQPITGALRKPKVVQALDRVTGGVFILFGARLALSRD